MADPVSIGFAIASIATAAYGAHQQSEMADAQYEAEKAAAEYQNELLIEEAAKARRENELAYQEAKSDRVRRANAEIAQAENAALGRGISGSTMMSMVRHLASAEGVDNARLARSFENQNEAISSQLHAGRVGQANRVTFAGNQAYAQSTSAVLGAVGSGLQIGSSAWGDYRTQKSAQNKKG